jgi:prolyl oligopeptidase
VWRGGRQFFTRRGPSQEHEVLLTTSADGTEQVLIDPAALDPAGLTTLDGWFASCEGDRLAYLLSAGGSEQPLLRVMDVTSGQTIDGPIDRTASAGVAWLPGGTAFYYQRRAVQRTGGTQARRLVYLHAVGSDPGQDIPVFGQDLDPAAFYVPMVSPDGRWMRLTVDWGTRGVDIYLADLAADGIGAPQFKVLQQGTGAISEASFGRDGRIYVLTDRDAPNRRLCAVDADRLDYEHWDTVLPEDPPRSSTVSPSSTVPSPASASCWPCGRGMR